MAHRCSNPGGRTDKSEPFYVVSQPFDGRIDVRRAEEGDYELRTEGLEGQPEGWQHFDPDAGAP